ncbi:MAG: MraY family glycosyltransferase [Capsulimonadaceae bacterium]|nr:MraY family glycosyltransferase [Capsulimonadaceae bacterium]
MRETFPLLPPVSFILAGLFCYLITPFVKDWALRSGAVAVPRERDVHKKPIPRWGGIAMYTAYMATIAAILLWYVIRHALHPHIPAIPWDAPQIRQFAGVLVGATLVALVGALDDKYELSAAWQSIALVSSGLVLFLCDVRIEGITNPFIAATVHGGKVVYNPNSWIPFSGFWSCFCTVIWVFGVAKTVDFMDGLDGLAAGISAISGITLAMMAAQAHQYEVSVFAAALVGVCVGFLRHNYNPATIIMGTIGAQFVGFLLAAIAIIGTFKMAATVSVALPILVLGVPIFDGIRVVTQRTIHHVPAHMPDRTSHLHHILINHGLSTKQAVWIIYGIAATLCIIAFALLRFVK